MINDNQDPTQMDYDYELGDPNGPMFEVGGTSNPNPNKKKKAKMPKARGLTFTSFEDILLVKSWLAKTLDPICGPEQKGNRYWEKIHKYHHEHKHYVEPHPIVTSMGDHSRGSEQVRRLLCTSAW